MKKINCALKNYFKNNKDYLYCLFEICSSYLFVILFCSLICGLLVSCGLVSSVSCFTSDVTIYFHLFGLFNALITSLIYINKYRNKGGVK